MEKQIQQYRTVKQQYPVIEIVILNSLINK